MVEWSPDRGAKMDPFGLAHALSLFCLGVFGWPYRSKMPTLKYVLRTMGSYD